MQIQGSLACVVRALSSQSPTDVRCGLGTPRASKPRSVLGRRGVIEVTLPQALAAGDPEHDPLAMLRTARGVLTGLASRSDI
jgi:hypothetical protein